MPRPWKERRALARTRRRASSVRTKIYRYRNRTCMTKLLGAPIFSRARQTALRPVPAINIKAALTVRTKRSMMEAKETGYFVFRAGCPGHDERQGGEKFGPGVQPVERGLLVGQGFQVADV